jgi:hypothetical protein
VLGVHQRQGFKPLAVQAQATAAAVELAAAMSSAMAAPPPLPKSPEDSADHEMEAVRLQNGTANPPSTMSFNAVAHVQHVALRQFDCVVPQEVASLMGRDSLSGYDVDCTEEGNVIREFLAQIASGE